MSIYPKKKGMIQLKGDSGESQANLKGAERIYSKADTRKIFDLARGAKNDKDLAKLGEFVYQATNRQDSSKPQFE